MGTDGPDYTRRRPITPYHGGDLVVNWIIDREVVDLNLTHAEIRPDVWCFRSSCLLCPFGKMSTSFRLPGSATELEINIWFCPSLIGCGQWLHHYSGLKRYPMCWTQTVRLQASHKSTHIHTPHNANFLRIVCFLMLNIHKTQQYCRRMIIPSWIHTKVWLSSVLFAFHVIFSAL